MCGFDDDCGDFEDAGFGDDGFIDDDSVEDGEFCVDLPCDDPEGLGDLDDEIGGSEKNESGEITAGYAFFIGSAIGWAYEEGRNEADRERLLKKEWREGTEKE